MKNKKLIILLIIVVISIGFAYIATDLNVNLTANIDAQRWDVHFENVAFTSESVAGTLPTIDTNKTTVNYTADLNMPGDKYEFTVDVFNNSTMDAMVSYFTRSSVPSYLELKYSYKSGLSIEQDDLLKAGGRETIIVTLSYRKDIDASQLPQTDVSGIECSIEIDYDPTYNAFDTPFDINAPVSLVFHSDEFMYFADENGNNLNIDTVTLNISDDYEDYDDFISDIDSQLGTVKYMKLYNEEYYPQCGTHYAIVMSGSYYPEDGDYTTDFYFTQLNIYHMEGSTKVLNSDYIQRIRRLGYDQNTIDVYPSHATLTVEC